MSKEYDVFDVICPYCGETSFGVILKPNTLHRIICPKCKHITYVKVLEDLSIQMYKEDEVCPECGGSGYVTCPKCGGDGYLIIISDFIEEVKSDPILELKDGIWYWHKEPLKKPIIKEEIICRVSEVESKIAGASVLRGWSYIGCPECGGRGIYEVIAELPKNKYRIITTFVGALTHLDRALEEISKGSGRIKCSKCNGKGFITKKKS